MTKPYFTFEIVQELIWMAMETVSHANGNLINGRYSVKNQTNFVDFSLFDCCWDGIKAGVVERLVVLEHPVNGMEQFTHDGTNRL